MESQPQRTAAPEGERLPAANGSGGSRAVEDEADILFSMCFSPESGKGREPRCGGETGEGTNSEKRMDVIITLTMEPYSPLFELTQVLVADDGGMALLPLTSPTPRFI